MRCLSFSALLLCLPSAMPAQTLPAGTAIPVVLSSSLNAKNAKTGEVLEGKLMQELLLSSGEKIKSGAHIRGHLVSDTRPSASGSRLILQFDQLQDGHQVFPLNVSLRAVAASENVFQAGLPVDSASTNESSREWVTRQVGGDIVFRGRGYVSSSSGKVAKWSGSGVWGQLADLGSCPGGNVGGGSQQALWIFSTTACGVYGLEDLKVGHDGSTAPVGQIALESTKDISIGGGSGWLLVVNAAGIAPK